MHSNVFTVSEDEDMDICGGYNSAYTNTSEIRTVIIIMCNEDILVF